MRFFGFHPRIKMEVQRRERIPGSLIPPEVPLQEFFSESHPEVYLIPRDRYMTVIDDQEPIGPSEILMPFSSLNFCADFEKIGGIFSELYHADAFWRLGGISQLGYLHSPKPSTLSDLTEVFYHLYQFPHKRWNHSLLTGMLAEVVLARNGFSEKERTPFVLAAACHDIATPAGGDSVMRIDPDNLSEEKNFSMILKKSGLAKRWKNKFDFDLSEAQSWIYGQGSFGKLLDVIDKIAYTALDAYYVGHASDNHVQKHCLRYPLVMDVWQDIRFDGAGTWFISAERLSQFLLLRAYLHNDLYLNPRSRALDHMLCNSIHKHYIAGEITRKQLLEWDDQRLERWIFEKEGIGGCVVSPDNLIWHKFETGREARNFAHKQNNLSHLEQIQPFKTGLDWLVRHGRRKMPLKFVLPERRITQLENLSRKYSGWYVYCFKKDNEFSF